MAVSSIHIAACLVIGVAVCLFFPVFPAAAARCYPSSLSYIRGRVTCESPIWSPALCARGNVIHMAGHRVVNKEGNCPRCVSTEHGYRAPGKYLFAYAIEEAMKYSAIMFGVRRDGFKFGYTGSYVGATADGWAYYAHSGKKYHAGNAEDYAVPAKGGDVISMLLDLDVGTLSFFRNGNNLGVAHSLPEASTFFPCVSLRERGHSVQTLSIQADCVALPRPVSGPLWRGQSLAVPFPHSLSFFRSQLNLVVPVWSPSMCAPGNTLDLDGRRIVKTEEGTNGCCVSTERGYQFSGKYLAMFAIDDSKRRSRISLGVRTRNFKYCSQSAVLGSTADGWAYQLHNGKTLHGGQEIKYAAPAKSGDVIGMLLDLDVGTLSFLRNGKMMGIAYWLPANAEFFPCVTLQEHGQSVLTLDIEEAESTASPETSMSQFTAHQM